MEETINQALDDATNGGILLKAQNEELKNKRTRRCERRCDSRDLVETVGNEVMRSGSSEILIAETRKSKKDEQPNNGEPEFEERELQWPEKQFEEERRKRI